MKRAFKSIFKDKPRDTQDIEAQLADVLRPVKPPDQFVRDLRTRLLEQVQANQHGSKLSTRNLGFLVLAGILSVVLVVVTGVRLLISLFVGVDLLRRFRRQPDQK
jgi:Flp pilus assembly protein TadB